MILLEESKKLYDARQAYAAAKQRRDAVQGEIDELVRQYAPSLLIQRDEAETDLSVKRSEEKAAYDAFTEKIEGLAYDAPDSLYGRGHLHPFVTVEKGTSIVPVMEYAGRIADFLVARGLEHLIKFDFKPVDLFRSIPEEQLPRTPDGLRTVIKIYQGPRIKVDSHERWTAPETWEQLEDVTV
jgi:hypothetical protein